MKMQVHNRLEAQVLIKEALKRGDFDRFDGMEWFTHGGEYLFHTEVHGDDVRMFTEAQAIRAAGLK